MIISERDINNLNIISQQLRIPEFKYRANDSGEMSGEIDAFFSRLLSYDIQLESGALIKTILKDFPMRPLPPEFINLAFTLDRLFDVWLRKSLLHVELAETISAWRIAAFSMLYKECSSAVFNQLVGLLEAIASRSMGWNPKPARSKHLYLKTLKTLEQQLFSYSPARQEIMDNLAAQWQDFISQQDAKREKIVDRLAQSEQTLATQRFSAALVQNYLNTRFKKRLLPESAQVFIQDYWLETLSRQCSADSLQEIPDELKTLTDKILIVFTSKGEAAFQASDTLLDELNSVIESQDMAVPEKTWEALQRDILKLLQKQNIGAKLFSPIERYDDLNVFSCAERHIPELNGWFLLQGDEGLRVTASAVFKEQGQVLFTNYLGMKQDRLALGEFAQALGNKSLKALAPDSSFASVIKTTLSGLLKVASTQKEARLKAANKAREEAERLLKEKEQADRDAKQRAEDIARRTREIRLKKEEKQRLEKEAEIVALLSELKLGAWVCRVEGDSRDRFKLAVKFSASKKYLFVDKMGIRKIEFSEPELVQSIIAGRIEILSDGAEFEASLERVVSRIRMSK